MAAALVGLGAAQREMSIRKQFIGIAAARWKDRHTDRCLDALGTIADRKRPVERRGEVGCKLLNIDDLSMRHRNRELIATQPRDCADTAELLLQALGHGTQHEIAVAVSEQIVDLLKAVEADDQQRGIPAPGCPAVAIRADSLASRV